jgi:hypothetical protein
MKAINSLLVVSILLFATVMSWTYFAVRGDQASTLPQAGIGGGPESPPDTAQLRTLFAEHGNLAVTHTTNLYDNKDISNTARQLENNTQALSEVVKELGTAADREAFLRTFRGHIDEYEIYTKGRKENQPAAVNIAKENLHMQAMDFGNLVHKIMPSISEQRGIELMNEHATLTLSIIDAHAKGDTSKKLNAMENANAQALIFAEELGAGAEEASK